VLLSHFLGCIGADYHVVENIIQEKKAARYVDGQLFFLFQSSTQLTDLEDSRFFPMIYLDLNNQVRLFCFAE
jgi:hypothetical protein